MDCVEVIEMIENLQNDINNIIMRTATKELNKKKEISVSTIDSIKTQINKSINDYIDYLLNY